MPNRLERINYSEEVASRTMEFSPCSTHVAHRSNPPRCRRAYVRPWPRENVSLVFSYVDGQSRDRSEPTVLVLPVLISPSDQLCLVVSSKTYTGDALKGLHGAAGYSILTRGHSTNPTVASCSFKYPRVFACPRL